MTNRWLHFLSDQDIQLGFYCISITSPPSDVYAMKSLAFSVLPLFSLYGISQLLLNSFLEGWYALLLAH